VSSFHISPSLRLSRLVADAARYVLSPTHLHEFKSADKTQAPVMSLYLPEQKLGSHSTEGGSSNKFVLKGRQTGSMHRGHTWVFRAESHDTMMAWYEDIRTLTERTPEERSNFVRGHVRSLSRASARSSMSSDGMGDDDEEPPFATAAGAVSQQQPRQDSLSRRPSGGRFPSDLQVNAQRGLQVPSPLSVSSGYADTDNHFAGSGGHTNHQSSVIAPLQQNGGYDGNRSRTATQAEVGSTFFPSAGHRDAYDIDAAQRATSPTYGRYAGENSISGTPGGMYRGAQDDRSVDHDAAIGAPIDARGFSDGSQVSRSQSRSSSANDGGRGRPLAQDAKPFPDWSGGRGAPDGIPGVREVTNGYTTDQRPRVGDRIDSVPTISHLHIPGEYPKGVAGYP
jgi:hypothetical protein